MIQGEKCLKRGTEEGEGLLMGDQGGFLEEVAFELFAETVVLFD
jgi:hypothetical protein